MNPQDEPTTPPAAPPLATIEDIRAHPKLAEDYSPSEREVIKSSVDKLTDEEKWAFNPILGTDYPAPSTLEEGGTPPPPTEPEKPVEPPAAPPPPAPAAAEPAPFTFKSEEELQAFIQKEIDGRKAAEEAEADKSKPKEPVKFFDENWKPANPNELIQAMIANPAFADALKEAISPKIMEDFQKATQGQRVAIKEFNNRLDVEYKDLATKNGLPALDTPEGQAINKQLATLSVAHGKDNYYDAYALWSIIPKDKGGGLDVTVPGAPSADPAPATAPVVDPAKAAAEAAKEKAGMVGGGGGGDNKPDVKQGSTYKDIHNLKMDQLIERAAK